MKYSSPAVIPAKAGIQTLRYARRLDSRLHLKRPSRPRASEPLGVAQALGGNDRKESFVIEIPEGKPPLRAVRLA